MANDPLSPVLRGEVLAIRADTWNRILEATGETLRPRRPDRPATPRPALGVVEALALNSTGADLREFRPAAVTAAGGYDVTGDYAGNHWQRNPLLTLGTPTGPGDHVAVTLEAIPAGRIGRVAIAGAVLCNTHVNDGGHGFAAPTTNTTALESAAAGPVRILHKGTGGSTRRCVVYLFAPGDGGAGCADYPQMYKRVVGVDFAGEKVHVRIITVDADGCETTGDVVCEDGTACTSGANLKYWCRSGVCWKVYDGITPPDGTGPHDTPEECATACVDAWYCTADYECVLVAAGDDPPAGAVSGPHATEEDCAAECVQPGLGCCPGVGVPATTYIPLSAGGTVTMTHDAGAGYWYGNKALAGCTVYFRVSEAGGCAGIEYSRDQVTWYAATCLNGEEGCVVVCSPTFSVTGTYTFSSAVLGGACSFGTITGTLTE